MKLPIIALVFAILLTGCDKLPINRGETAQNDVAKSIEQENVENQDTDIETLEAKFKEEQEKFSQEFGEIEPVSYNPCVDSELVNGIKQGIKDEAVELISSRIKVETAQHLSENIYGSDITLGNIYDSNGVCVATATVSYIGNNKTKDNMMPEIVQLINEDIQSTGGLYDLFSGSMSKKTLEKLGVNQFNIDDLNSFKGNSFSGAIQYRTKEFLNESGEQQIGWQAQWDVVPNMLAVTAMYDLMLQNIEKSNEKMQKEKVEREKRQLEVREKILRSSVSRHIDRYWTPPADFKDSVKVDITFTPDGEIIKHKIHSNDEAVIQSLQEALSKRIRINNVTPKLTENQKITLHLQGS
ncbi:energy transducer TonB [Faucicola boevrei]|uniref:hypothetical protein n=1 Tax=Faucicola boevrei TaxID=346665 RepID=UPI00037F037B|nr:hypothetical protein [Moraxella boevrei]